MSEGIDRVRVLEILKAADKMVTDRYGTKMLVVLWESGSSAAQDAPRAQWLRDSFKQAGIATIATSQLTLPLDDAQYYIAGDGHPNAAGYAVVAKAIADYCPGLNCLMPP